MDAKEFADLAMRDWQTHIDAMPESHRHRIESEAAALATHYARISAYISRRLAGADHAKAVKAQNVTARQVRRVRQSWPSGDCANRGCRAGYTGPLPHSSTSVLTGDGPTRRMGLHSNHPRGVAPPTQAAFPKAAFVVSVLTSETNRSAVLDRALQSKDGGTIDV